MMTMWHYIRQGAALKPSPVRMYNSYTLDLVWGQSLRLMDAQVSEVSCLVVSIMPMIIYPVAYYKVKMICNLGPSCMMYVQLDPWLQSIFSFVMDL